MASSNQNKERKGKSERVVPRVDTRAGQRTSRASGAAGGISSKGTQVEQRVNNTPRKGASAPRSRTPRAAGSARPQANTRRSPAPPSTPAPTRDVRFITWLRDNWQKLEVHQQQRFYSVLLLVMSLLLLAFLTVLRTAPVVSIFYEIFIAFFGWSAYLLATGLVVFSVANLVEGIRKQPFIRWSLVSGLVVLWLLVLAESRLILGGKTGGVAATLLVYPLQGWPATVGHVLLLGLFVIVSILTFRITFRHVLLVGRFIGLLAADSPNKTALNKAPGPSPYLGQRPQYSRYSSGAGSAVAGLQRADSRAPADDEDEDDEGAIEFEADFEDDPHNDINIHKQEIGQVPRGTRRPAALDPNEHKVAVQGARQQELPLHEQPTIVDKAGIGALRNLPEMEPLPLKVKPPVIVTRKAQAELAIQSPWQLPDITLLNHPEEVKLHLQGDDTVALAKIIQDTLRSFRVEAEVRPEDISIGPTVIRFGIRPTGKPEMKADEKGRLVPVRDGAGAIIYETRTRVSRIMALQNDLALVLEAKTIRMEAPVPGRPYVGVEIPNKNSRLVTLREVLESKEYHVAKAKSKLAIALGKDVAGAVRVGDLARMPHLLIAGATGAGKCLAYDEPVFLADGRIVKVQELLGQTVQVIGVTDTQTMRQIPVAATLTDNGVQEIYEVELDNGIILRRTGEHPLWAAQLDENQHVGRQADGKAKRRTRAINTGWLSAKDLRVCGNRPHFDGHVILCSRELHQKGAFRHSDADEVLLAVQERQAEQERATNDWNAWRQARPQPDQKFADCPEGYEWRKVVAIRRSVAPTVNIEVHSENHAFVGYAVEHNSVMINAIIASLLMQATSDDVRLLLVDPKMVELIMYNGIPHLLMPVVTEVEKVVGLLKNAIGEMEKRYRLFSKLGVRNLDGYRKMRAERAAQGDATLLNLPAIVIIIDELADLMMAAPEEVEGMICRLAQLARATGIHLVVATQRPSVDVITGLIKANIPTRISFMVSSAIDSRTIIDMGGAERLLGRGDMLYLPADIGKPERIQGAFLADEEAERIVGYWRQHMEEHNQAASGAAPVQAASTAIPVNVVEPGWEVQEAVSDDFELDDDLLEQAEQVVREYGRASISLLQRRLRIGYSRAARLIDLLEEQGTIGPSEVNGRPREVFDNRASGRSNSGEGHTMADEVEDIVAEEKMREEFLKKQQERENSGHPDI